MKPKSILQYLFPEMKFLIIKLYTQGKVERVVISLPRLLLRILILHGIFFETQKVAKVFYYLKDVQHTSPITSLLLGGCPILNGAWD
jgi:hypothetical protein